MKVEQAQLNSALKLVSMAVAADAFIPIVSHFCFTGKSVYGYNGSMAIRQSLPEGMKLTGGVPAGPLTRILGSMKGKQLELDITDALMVIKSGRSSVKLPVLDAKEFVFEWPKPGAAGKGSTDLDVTEALLVGLRKCMATCDDKAPIACHTGITLLGAPGGFDIFSTNDNALSRYHIESTDTAKLSAMLPKDFCSALIALCGDHTKEKDTVKLRIGKDYAGVHDGTAYMLYAALPDVGDLANFDEMIQACMPKKKLSGFPVSDSLVNALNRAIIMSGDVPIKRVSASYTAGKLKLSAKSPVGESKDEVTFRGSTVNHKDFHNFEVPPDLLLKALDLCTSVCFAEKVVICSSDDGYEQFVLYCSDITTPVAGKKKDAAEEDE